MDIDLVYLWVDGNDPAWKRKHDAVAGHTVDDTQTDCKGRYANNDELRYSLRSIELYAPWIRKIFIVTDNQRPEWLDISNSRVEIVDHTSILPEDALPCFNSPVIEYHLHKIPGLSEHFLYANDDMMLNKPVGPEDFFTPEGEPVMRVVKRPFVRWKEWFLLDVLHKRMGNHNAQIRNSGRLVKERYGQRYTFKPHHNIDAYTKSLCRATVEEFSEQLIPTFAHHLRNDEDYQRVLYYYMACVLGKGKPVYVDGSTSFQLAIHKPYHYPRMEKYDPTFFCMNDSENATDEHRRMAKEYLAGRFPDKSGFEK